MKGYFEIIFQLPSCLKILADYFPLHFDATRENRDLAKQMGRVKKFPPIRIERIQQIPISETFIHFLENEKMYTFTANSTASTRNVSRSWREIHRFSIESRHREIDEINYVSLLMKMQSFQQIRANCGKKSVATRTENFHIKEDRRRSKILRKLKTKKFHCILLKYFTILSLFHLNKRSLSNVHKYSI